MNHDLTTSVEREGEAGDPPTLPVAWFVPLAVLGRREALHLSVALVESLSSLERGSGTNSGAQEEDFDIPSTALHCIRQNQGDGWAPSGAGPGSKPTGTWHTLNSSTWRREGGPQPLASPRPPPATTTTLDHVESHYEARTGGPSMVCHCAGSNFLHDRPSCAPLATANSCTLTFVAFAAVVAAPGREGGPFPLVHLYPSSLLACPLTPWAVEASPPLVSHIHKCLPTHKGGQLLRAWISCFNPEYIFHKFSDIVDESRGLVLLPNAWILAPRTPTLVPQHGRDRLHRPPLLPRNQASVMNRGRGAEFSFGLQILWGGQLLSVCRIHIL
ncbi:hypothetical protein B0H63DRAFT_57313 [Podospora didyma]|uniref:Uncharacterized protein n=1 Tax=Podospora didyma TaxID=330526 RepID=A0AAE0P7E9_9PEZI|nr:hypothetical protein B0H63DRAFT_57313 [Podospora didyma]